MSNGKGFDRYSRLQTKIGMMILDGKRDGDDVADVLQVVLGKEEFKSILLKKSDAPKGAEPVTDWFAEMAKFYKDVFGMDLDMSQVALSADPGGFGWALFVAQGITLNQVWAKCKQRFPSSFSVYGDDLDKAVIENDRNTAVGYVKRFRDRVEADKENKNISASTLKQNGAQSITLLERLLLELWYHWKTGKHLDIQNWTLCAGSRDNDGDVPCVCWLGCKLQVSRCHPDLAYGSIRARSEV